VSRNRLLTQTSLASRDAGLFFDLTLDTVEDAAMDLRKKFFSQSSKDKGAKRRVILLGTGWSSLAVSKILDPDNFEVITISPRPYFVFSPMLVQSALGTVEYRSIVEPTRECNPTGTYIRGEVTDVLPERKEVVVETSVDGKNSKLKMSYDHLIIGVGAQVNNFGVKGVYEHCNFLN
jgi:NADH dehydrogenase FAD-containing subunit